ncbi:MAG: hypothetical protein Q8O67_13390 [Deltaproteobacteria bacterium]|nr:hypothetical protein [Deltaproteobacteria bacterium]
MTQAFTARVVQKTADFGVVVVGPVVVSCWRAGMQAERMAQLLEVYRAQLLAFPSIAGVIWMPKQRFAPPDAASRKVLAEIETAIGARTAALAIVLEGSPMVMATARAVVAGIGLVSHEPYPRSIVGSLEEGARAVAAKSGMPTSTEITAAARLLDPA